MNLKFYLTGCFLSGKKIIFPVMAAIAFQTISCNIINPAEPIPAYVHIDSFILSTDSVTQGSNSANIVDAWIYVDGNIIGTYELPATFPVLHSGSHKLTIRPGILIDGIASTRTIYPFYSGYDTVVNFESEKIVHASPKVTYLSTANVIHREDFDNPSGTNIIRAAASDTSIIIIPPEDPNSFEGSSGAAYLDNDHPYFECAWKDSFLIPVSRPAYIELNYKTDNEFTVGIISYTSTGVYIDDLVIFRTTQTWKKQYISLEPVIGNTITATGFKVYIKSIKNSALSNASLYFDNIKVVY
jgi:hypothetical protein